MAIYAIGWRNDLNWVLNHFRIIADTYDDAIVLAEKLSGVPRRSLYCDTREDRSIPLFDGKEFVYPKIDIYSNAIKSSGRSYRQGEWYNSARVHF